MKFTCLQENLTNGLTKVYRAVPTKSELPILSNVMISAKDNRLTLSATNLSTTIVTHVGASIETDGAITIPAKMLRDFIANLSSDTVEALLKDDILHINSDITKSRFNGVSAQDFPDLPEEKEDLEILEFDPQTFYNAVSSVSFCASLDDSRPVFTGIYVDFDGKTMTMAASDGFRLSETKLTPNNKGDKFTVVIPAKTLMDVARVYTDSENPITFTLDKNDNLVLFKQNDTLIATRVLTGEYPDYSKIIPDNTNTRAEFFSHEFLEAVKLTDIFAKEADSALLLKINPKGAIEITASSQETGGHKSKFNADVEAEEPVKIGFNSKYLLDFLNNIKSEKLVIRTNGDASPCIFEPLEIENFIHIIMPMQINR
ncbi:DNA polymerase III subunit beta [Patescibacteria group bacterium]